MALIRWPLLWGGLASLGFYALIHEGYLDGEFARRYFTSHPVEHAEVTLFFIGLAALIVKGIDLASQFAGLDRVTLGEPPAHGQKIEEVGPLLDRLRKSAGNWRENYLPRRLSEALEYIRRKGSADTLDEHLRYASDLDAGRMQASYALVRIIIWAIPILGFLGTVIGITMAIAQLSPDSLESSLPEVVHGLQVAFDTTALALALSIVLMFAQFIADRFETQLLEQVDDRAAGELVGRFEEYGAATDPQAASIRRMADAVIDSTKQLVERQAELWRDSLDAAQAHWTTSSQNAAGQLEASLATAGEQLERTLDGAGERLDQALSANTKRIEGALAGALAVGLKQHAAALTEAERELADKHYQQWREIKDALAASTEAVQNQHGELLKQSDALKQVIEAAGEVRSLERTLNDNLSALSATHNFEETVLSLSAALQLLSAQLHAAGPAAPRGERLSPSRPSAPHAA
jgi:hypothetical protein